MDLNYIRLNKRSQQFHNTGAYLPEPKPIEYGLIGGVGLQVRRFSLEGRYEAAKGVMANYVSISAVPRSVYLLLGYQIN